MKLNKKVLSCFLAGTMVMAPMSAFAEDVPTGSSTITGSGQVSILDTEIYNVVLPTDEGINFKVDPFGLLNITTESNLEDVVSNAGGTVTSAATAVINKSSVDINVKIESWLIASPSSLTLADSKADAEDSKDLYLAITPLKNFTVADVEVTPDAGQVVTLSEAAITGTLSEISAEAVTAKTEASANALTVSLEDVAKAYMVTSTGAATLSEDAVVYDDKNTYAFAISGYANPESEVWQMFKEPSNNCSLALKMKFTISGADAAPAELEPSVAADANSYYYSVDGQVGFTNISSVTVNDVEQGTSVINAANFVVIPKSTIQYFVNSAGSATVKIVDANGTYVVEY